MTKIEFETFKKLDPYMIRELTQESPSCFNGNVCVKKYLVTIERVEESDDAVRGRIQALWDANENHHRARPLIEAGRKYGMDLKGQR